MRRYTRFLSLCTLGAMLAGCGGGQSGAAPAPPNAPTTLAAAGTTPATALQTLPEIASQNGSVSLTLIAKFDSNNRPAFFYNNNEVAPTIRVQPGDTIHLTYVNQLPQFCDVGVETDTNLHFHGLTSSPNAPGDDVITTVAVPGASVTYTIVINSDQPPGMYWYHPHPHGLTSYEVGNGMAGAIVVEGIAGEVPQTAGLRERVIVLGDVPTSNTFSAGESAVTRRTRASRRTPSDSDEGGPTCSPETDATPTINGKPFATIGIKPGETQLFRVLNASGHRHFDITIGGAPLTLVAQDGVPIHDYPGAPATLSATHVVIPPAGRAEFLVTGTSTPQPFLSQCYDSGSAGDADPQVILGSLTDDSTWPQTSNTTTETRVRKTAALRHSQFYRVALPAPAATHTIHFQEDANGFYLDGASYDPSAPPTITSHTGTVEEWTLENDTNEVHVFHIHQVHFIVESVNGVAQPNAHWLDTFDLPPIGIGVQGQIHPSQTKVLIDFRDPVIAGTFLYHCHILDHEDGGMAATIKII